MRSRICGTGSALPKREVTNDDLSKIMDTSDEWIKSRTGIGARHLAVEETLTQLAAQAASQALQEAGVRSEELDMIIAATLLTLTRRVPVFYLRYRRRMRISAVGNAKRSLS